MSLLVIIRPAAPEDAEAPFSIYAPYVSTLQLPSNMKFPVKEFQDVDCTHYSIILICS